MLLQAEAAAKIRLRLISVASDRQPSVAKPFAKQRSSRRLPAVLAKQHAAQPAQPRNSQVVELRRGDLTWRQPPWHFDCTTTADALQLDGLKEIDSMEARASEVAVHYTVSPAGAGYFVTGEANAHLPLQCDCCLATFRQPVTAPFKLWLDPSISTDEMPNDPSQIPFPREMSAIDLGPAVTDAIIVVLPSTNLCGRPDCNIKYAQSSSTGASGWSASPDKKSTQKAKVTGQFASLKHLGKA